MTAARNPSTTGWRTIVEAYLLIGLGAMLLRKIWIGQLTLYIHPRYELLVLAAAVVILLMGASSLVQNNRASRGLHGRAGIYSLLLTPVLLGVLLPAKPTGSALVDPSQLNRLAPRIGSNAQLVTSDSSQWTLLDWAFARSLLTPEQTSGRPVDVVGFVYRSPGVPADQIDVVRYAVACCVADRTGLSLTVYAPDAAALANDQWVRVTGTMAMKPDGAGEYLVADAQIEAISQPEEPYLYYFPK